MSVTTEAPDSGLRGSPRDRRADPIYRGVMYVAASSVLVILAAMIIRTSIEAWPVFRAMGIWGFVSGDLWSVGTSRSEVTGTYGAWPFIYGTLKISFIAIVFAVPLAIGIALYTNELAPDWLRRPLVYAVDTLAMVPSIVYALVGMYFFRIEIWAPVGQAVAGSPLGAIPFFSGPVLLSSYWSAANILTIMILPIITAICRDVFAQVPLDERNAAYAMGATRWEVMSKVIVPRSFSGIVGGTMLGLGRALGETLAVAVLIGSTQRWIPALFQGGDAMTSVIANTFQDAHPEAIWALLAIGVTLFFITMFVNVGARIIVSRVSARVGGGAVL
ncbi:MAG: phosphate ABC transporter permease subunit PstC [Nitriliruptoraceae bacterium]|nr:phosphate ABC transporter permease subunit PstC [Nitriliruptoraceae bacterium]